MLIFMAVLSCYAQTNRGTITPVESDDHAPQQPVLHYFDKHGNKLDTPVLYLAELDTVSKIRPSSPYPLFNGVTVGVNFADAIMTLIGQKHSSYDVSAMVSLHNWFFPIVEVGVGWGNYTDNNNDLYKVKAYPAVYAKIGINYNFLYKSNPEYMAYVGGRFGISNHRWDKTDIKTTNEEGESITSPDELDRHCVSIYGEVLAGLKVKVAGPFSLGWNVRYRLGLHNSRGQTPWFVPGYGTGPLGFTFNAYLTFGEKKKKPTLPDILPPDSPAPNTPNSYNITNAPNSPAALTEPDI